MATCKNCIGYEYCNPQPKNPRKVEKWCDRFKNKADFVEVVRCKDCKYWTTENDGCCTNLRALVLVENENKDFCCRGVRRGAEGGN